MAELIFRSENSNRRETRLKLEKPISTVGTDASHDFSPPGASSAGLLFTVIHSESKTSIMPGSARLKLNGAWVSRTADLSSCDRLEWAGGAAIFLRELPDARASALASKAGAETAAMPSTALGVLGFLQDLAASLQGPGSLDAAIAQALVTWMRMADAEVGYLLAEGEGGRWDLVAANHAAPESEGDARRTPETRQELFSNSVLQEALRKREPVYIENIIGHPLSGALSVIEARLFSAACFPLLVGDRVLGAIYLFTRSPGRVIRREAIPELSLLATQAALMLASQAELRNALRENDRLQKSSSQSSAAPALVFSRAPSAPASPMLEIEKKIAKVAGTSLNVLVRGETGTGKEIVAREIHRLSARGHGPFVAVNCAAIPATLLESTLFGHEKGAFTGAYRAQAGKFALADGGTLFLDEIGDLSSDLQVKLLRVLQERQVEPLGAASPLAIDVRILAATHQDLETSVRRGTFRQDLYFRLNGVTLSLPPLRERRQDLAALSAHFLDKHHASEGDPRRAPPRLSAEARELMENYAWPGNVRELEQVLLRAASLSESPEILARDLELSATLERMDADTSGDLPAGSPVNLEAAQVAFTSRFVQQALARESGNRAQTARKLGISERTLYRILSASPGMPNASGARGFADSEPFSRRPNAET